MDSIEGIKKAAILLISLGPDVSAQIFKHLREEDIEKLTLEIANQRKIPQEQKDKVMAEFHQMCLAKDYISSGGLDYAREILEKAPEKAEILLEIGMHCLGCPASQMETLEEACGVHGIDVEEVIEKLKA